MTRHTGAARLHREVESLQQLRKWDGLSRIDDVLRKLGQQQNVFRLLRRVIRDESVHSDMVAWLLDPDAWHGLGDGFSSRFTKGEWQCSVRRDGFARLFRPAWRRLGTRQDDAILGLSGQTDWTYARAHLRLVADPPESDEGRQHRYQVKLKVDTRHAGKLRDSVLRILARISGLKSPSDEEQFTISIKSKANLPSVADKPDTVLDWMVRLPHVREVVEGLDSVLA